MPQNPKNEISQTLLKHYNQIRSAINEALIWLQITTYTGKKLKVEPESKEGYQQLLDFFKIEIIKVERQNLQNETSLLCLWVQLPIAR